MMIHFVRTTQSKSALRYKALVYGDAILMYLESKQPQDKLKRNFKQRVKLCNGFALAQLLAF